LTLATGDLTKPEVCPGPFDAVIERRVVQLFAEPDRAVAIDRLAARLATPGVLISHHHDGCGRPGQVRHHAMKLLTERGFVLDSHADADAQRSAPRLARLRLSTG